MSRITVPHTGSPNSRTIQPHPTSLIITQLARILIVLALLVGMMGLPPAATQAEPLAAAVKTDAEHNNTALNAPGVAVDLDDNVRASGGVMEMGVDAVESVVLTCTLARSVPGASAVGTVTVNTLGSVAAANFTAWSVAVTTTNSVVLTQLNSVLDLGDHPPAITATASSLTVVPEPADSLPMDSSSNFGFVKGGYSGQFYGLFHDNGQMGPSSAEVFRYDGSLAGQVFNDSPPAELNLPCTCVGCPAPSLSLSKTASPTAEIAYRGVVTYTLVLSNTDAAADPQVALTDTLPATADFAYWIEQSGATANADVITWQGAVAAGETITVAFAITNTASGGATITNTVTFSGSAQTGSADATYSATTSQCYPSGSGPWTAVMAGCTAPSAKVIIPAGVTVTLDQDVTLSDDFEVEAGATFNPNGKTVTLTGDQPQTLTGNPLTFYNLVVNKTNKTDIVTIVGKLKVTKKLIITKGKLVSASDYEDIEIEADGELALTSAITVGGHFTNTGTLTTDSHGIIFDGAKAQNLTLNVFTWFDDLTVAAGTTLIETVTDDNAYVQGTLTNNGVIRKTQPVTGVSDPYNFGLAGEYNGADLEITVTDLTGADPLTAIQVDHVAGDHAGRTGEAGHGVGWGHYWTITLTGSDFVADVTLPHDVTPEAEATACRFLSGTTWDCKQDAVTADTVTYTGTTHFSDWAVGNNVPLAAPLETLAATATPAGAVIAWETTSELDARGYHVYRADAAAGAWTRLTGAPLPSQAPGSPGGHAYRWLDVTAQRGAAYRYRVTAVELAGAEMPLAAVAVQMPAAWLWLPVMTR